MGMDVIWHLLILVIVLAVPVTIIVLIVRLLRRPPRATPSAVSAEARLRELASLKARGVVTEAEYERQRSAIVGDI